MKRRLIAGVLALACVAVMAASALAAAGVPVLGWKQAWMNGEGFGSVSPRQVYFGGDPTGNFVKLRWAHWGAGRTTASGMGWCPGQTVAQGHPCAVRMTASALGTCHGRHAYRKLSITTVGLPGRPGVYNVCPATVQ